VNTGTNIGRPAYFDSAATTRVIPEVRDEVLRYLDEDFGNAGSRTHDYGAAAKRRVVAAREQVSAPLGAAPEGVIFTSGATEANNLAILGLAPALREADRMHVITSAVEHKAVLEPAQALERQGFDVTIVPVDEAGRIDLRAFSAALRPTTGLVSLQHANNETGVLQPVLEVAEHLDGHPAYLHIDAAQGYGKRFDELRCERVDLLSLSAHKFHGPKGVGALVMRRRGFRFPPIASLTFGGGQERGLRPGTLPVHLIAGLGTAAELAEREIVDRTAHVERLRDELLDGLQSLSPQVNGAGAPHLPNIASLSFDAIDAEAALVALRDLVAVAVGSACTSTSYEESHVLVAMGLPPARRQSALRFSWDHMTASPDWKAVAASLAALRPTSTAA
jgi:cysteine desulfurase